MPLTSKGEKIKAALTKEYGEKGGERVLYAGKNKGTFTGIDALADAVVAMCDSVDGMKARIDARLVRRIDEYCGTVDDHRVTGGVQIPPNPDQIRNALGLRFDASFPTDFKHAGKTFYATGKKGKNRASGEASAEYEAVDKEGRHTGERVWRTASGKVVNE